MYNRHRTMMDLQRTDNEKAPNAHSILGIMKNFIDSVNEMDETVLIPSRLMDIKMGNSESMLMANGSHDYEDLSMSVIPTSLRDSSSKPMPHDEVSLHTYYAMLKAVKQELARGPMSEELVAEEDESLDAESTRLQRATARAFREHLRGLFSILSHLTSVSKHLMTTYQQETGDQQSCLKPKTFTV